MKTLAKLLLPLGILLAACGPQNSALSDVELDDPSLISPQIVLEQKIDEDNRITASIEVFLKDKNNDWVELKKGEVRVNGEVMRVYIDGEAPYYSTAKVGELLADTEYEFEIELADGKVYKASVKTPVHPLETLTLPEDRGRYEDMKISWEGIHVYDDMKANLKLYYETETEKNTKSESLNVSRSDQERGKYSIGWENFTFAGGAAYMAEITLTGEIDGKIDKHFGRSSMINCKYSITREVDIRD